MCLPPSLQQVLSTETACRSLGSGWPCSTSAVQARERTVHVHHAALLDSPKDTETPHAPCCKLNQAPSSLSGTFHLRLNQLQLKQDIFSEVCPRKGVVCLRSALLAILLAHGAGAGLALNFKKRLQHWHGIVYTDAFFSKDFQVAHDRFVVFCRVVGRVEGR